MTASELSKKRIKDGTLGRFVSKAKQDPIFQTFKNAGSKINKFTGSTLSKASNISKNMAYGKMKPTNGLMTKMFRGGFKPAFALGAVAMLGIGFMNGAMSSAREAVYDRYMQDTRYSRNMLHNTRIGVSTGTSRMLNRDGTQGLSLALSKNRHG